jgi:BMFP domain-containing protein YqiC
MAPPAVEMPQMTTAELLARIDTLEARVAELEDAPAQGF